MRETGSRFRQALRPALWMVGCREYPLWTTGLAGSKDRSGVGARGWVEVMERVQQQSARRVDIDAVTAARAGIADVMWQAASADLGPTFRHD